MGNKDEYTAIRGSELGAKRDLEFGETEHARRV